MIQVNGNTQNDVKVLYTPGIEWTIRDGVPYHGPSLWEEVKEMVAKARQ